jgi:putative SOS response-associated peptidase YedK
MCNRYASDIRKAGLERSYYGYEEFSETRIQLNSVLEVFPNSIGPVLRPRLDGALEWTAMRWGLPAPNGSFPVTNVRNLASSHWRPILGPASRCLVPFTAFSEYEDTSPKGKKRLRWFASPDRGMMMFAGLWQRWSGDRGTKKEPNHDIHLLFSFLTTEPNDLVRPIHAKAMPVILRTNAERDEWLTAPDDQIAAI